jgi:hypothetical protein
MAAFFVSVANNQGAATTRRRFFHLAFDIFHLSLRTSDERQLSAIAKVIENPACHNQSSVLAMTNEKCQMPNVFLLARCAVYFRPRKLALAPHHVI